MKKNLCILLVCLLSAAAPLQAQDMQQAQKLIDQAQKYLYNNPKQASYYAAQASALFPEEEPSEVRAQAMILYCQAEQLLGNFDLSIKNLYDTQKYIHPTNKKQMAQQQIILQIRVGILAVLLERCIIIQLFKIVLLRI